jgi:hypothetical protein
MKRRTFITLLGGDGFEQLAIAEESRLLPRESLPSPDREDQGWLQLHGKAGSADRLSRDEGRSNPGLRLQPGDSIASS